MTQQRRAHARLQQEIIGCLYATTCCAGVGSHLIRATSSVSYRTDKKHAHANVHAKGRRECI
jgi:hypothetical protein